MADREVIRERPAERERVVEERGAPPPGRGGGGIVAAIIGIILVLIIGWFLLNALGIMGEAADNATDGGETQQIEGDLDVDVDGGAEGGAEGEDTGQ